MGSRNTWASVKDGCRGALGGLAGQLTLCVTYPSPFGVLVSNLGWFGVCTEHGQVLVCRGVIAHWSQGRPSSE